MVLLPFLFEIVLYEAGCCSSEVLIRLQQVEAQHRQLARLPGFLRTGGIAARGQRIQIVRECMRLRTQCVDAPVHVAEHGLSGLHRAHHSVIAPPATATR